MKHAIVAALAISAAWGMHALAAPPAPTAIESLVDAEFKSRAALHQGWLTLETVQVVCRERVPEMATAHAAAMDRWHVRNQAAVDSAATFPGWMRQRIREAAPDDEASMAAWDEILARTRKTTLDNVVADVRASGGDLCRGFVSRLDSGEIEMANMPR